MTKNIEAFYSKNELAGMGFKSVGDNVSVSRRASIYNAGNISLGSHVRIDDFCVLSGGKQITIGNYVHIGCFCGLYGGTGINIGSYSTLSSRVALYSESDDFSGESLTNPTIPAEFKPKYIKGLIHICNHVVVGTNSTVLPGVTINDGVAIGAHSLVKGDCEPWTIYSGTPVKIIRPRSRALLKLLEKFHRNLPGISTD